MWKKSELAGFSFYSPKSQAIHNSSFWSHFFFFIFFWGGDFVPFTTLKMSEPSLAPGPYQTGLRVSLAGRTQIPAITWK